MELNEEQISAVKCALADLQGIIQAKESDQILNDVVDFDAIYDTISELESTFEEVLADDSNISIDDEIGDGMTDVETDADTLKNAGWGDDSDYGGDFERL